MTDSRILCTHSVEEVTDQQNGAENVSDSAAVPQICTRNNNADMTYHQKN